MKKIKKNYFKVNGVCPVYFIFILFLFIGCKKDKISNECKDFDSSQLINVLGGPHYKFIGEQLRTPSFNPNDDNEIMFVRESTGTQDKQIYIYNLVNKSKELVYEGDLWGRPSWGKNDYIIFYKLGGHIWKIRSNGQDLTYLNNPFEVYDPQWNSEGTKFAANAPISQAPNQLIIFDESGNVLDSVELPRPFSSPSSFEHEDILIIREAAEIIFFDLNNKLVLNTYYPQANFNNSTGFGGNIFWLDSTNLILSNRDGIHEITFPELQNTHIVKGCTDRVYASGSLNSTKSKIIWSVYEREINENKTHINVKQYLVLMDVGGSNEQRLEIKF
jgi:hypothetical protein